MNEDKEETQVLEDLLPDRAVPSSEFDENRSG